MKAPQVFIVIFFQLLCRFETVPNKMLAVEGGAGQGIANMRENIKENSKKLVMRATSPARFCLH